jgi:hypothetical protein
MGGRIDSQFSGVVAMAEAEDGATQGRFSADPDRRQVLLAVDPGGAFRLPRRVETLFGSGERLNGKGLRRRRGIAPGSEIRVASLSGDLPAGFLHNIQEGAAIIPVCSCMVREDSDLEAHPLLDASNAEISA